MSSEVGLLSNETRSGEIVSLGPDESGPSPERDLTLGAREGELTKDAKIPEDLETPINEGPPSDDKFSSESRRPLEASQHPHTNDKLPETVPATSSEEVSSSDQTRSESIAFSEIKPHSNNAQLGGTVPYEAGPSLEEVLASGARPVDGHSIQDTDEDLDGVLHEVHSLSGKYQFIA